MLGVRSYGLLDKTKLDAYGKPTYHDFVCSWQQMTRREANWR